MNGFYYNNELEASDEGQQARDIEAQIDLEILINRLPEKQREIAILLSEGYTCAEVSRKLKVARSTITRIRNKMLSYMV